MFICCLTSAQDDETLRRLHGTVIKDNVFLRWNEAAKEFQYTVDTDAALWRSVKKGMLYNARNNHGNSVGLHIQFYNPLKYVTKLSFKDVDDPLYQAVLQFLSSLSPSEAATGADADALSSLRDKLAGNAAQAMLAHGLLPVANLDDFNGSIILSQWTQEFITSVDYNMVLVSPEKAKLYNELVTLVNKHTKKVDNYLFKTILIGGNIQEDHGFNDWILSRKNALFNSPADLDRFNKEVAIADQVLGELQQARKDAEDGLKQLQKLLTEDYNAKVKPLIQTPRQTSFGHYSAAEAYWQGNDVSDKIDKHKEALAQYKQLVERLQKFTADFARDRKGYRLENSPSFDYKTKTMRNFVYEIKELDINGKDVAGSQHSAEFTIAKFQSVIPFVSTGAFYTGFRYPNYALTTAEGANRVAETDPTDVRVRPAVFLNFLFKTGSDWFYPLLQIGVSTGVNDFLLPVGAGIAINNRVSISGGVMIGWRKDLTKLKVGDVVKDDAELKNDLSNRGAASWFFSVNYNFIK